MNKETKEGISELIFYLGILTMILIGSVSLGLLWIDNSDKIYVCEEIRCSALKYTEEGIDLKECEKINCSWIKRGRK